MMRVTEEENYWDNAAQDKDVDIKYISDISTEKCLSALGKLNGKVLEIGCGVGRLLQPGFSGIDISEKMLNIARKRKPECNFFQCNGRNIPFPDGELDTVYSVLVFQHLPEEAIKTYIEESSRVLKKGGYLKFQFIEGNEQEPFSKHYSIDQIKEWLNKSGFKIKKNNKGLVHFQWTWIEAEKI